MTGAARRLGRAIALDLASQGWDVAFHCNSSTDEAEEAVAEAGSHGVKAAAVQADLLDEDAAGALVGRAREALGRPLTLLVNNASIFENDDLETATRTSWDRAIGSNLRAPVRLTQEFAAQAPAAGVDENGEPIATGLVVNMIDQRIWRPTPDFMSYFIAKSGLYAFTKWAALSLAPGIRVNGIGPGPTLVGATQRPEHFENQRRNVILERGVNASDICGGVRFLISSPAMTGQMIALDSGQHLAWRTPDVEGVFD